MLRIATPLVVCLLAIAGSAVAQSTTSPQSPNDPLSRMLASVPQPAADTRARTAPGDDDAADERPTLTREAAIEVFDRAIGFAKSLRGAAKVAAVPGLSEENARGLERGLRADRVDAATADRPNEWTAALMKARGRIAKFVPTQPVCEAPASAAPARESGRGRRRTQQTAPAPAKVTPSAWGATTEPTAIEDYAKELHKAYCELGPFLLPQPPASAPTDSDEEAASTFAASFLPFAALTAGNTAPQASAQLADLFFTNRWRFHMRSTYQPKKAETKDEGEAAEGAEPTAEELAKKVDDKVRNAMLDPFGGDLNLAFGHYSKVRTPFFEGNANDAEHGLFIDARAGMKLIELPEQSLTLNEGPSSITPFYTASLGVRLRLPTYFDRLIQHRAGATELGIVYGLTGIVDRTASTLFSRTEGVAPLPRQVRVLHVSLGVDITDIVRLGLSGNVWSNTGLTKRVMAEFSVLSKKDKPAE